MAEPLQQFNDVNAEEEERLAYQHLFSFNFYSILCIDIGYTPVRGSHVRRPVLSEAVVMI